VRCSLIAMKAPETVARRGRRAPDWLSWGILTRPLMIAVISAWCWCSPAFAQVEEDIPAPISPTSPLGIDSTTSIGGTGIRLGATEIPSAGVSPLPTYSTGTVALPGSGTTCSTLGTSPSGLIGSIDTYDGGGMAMGSATTATGATAGTATMSGTTSTSGSTQMAGMSADPGMLPISGMSTTSGIGTVGVSGLCGFSSGDMATSPTTPTSTTPTTPGGNPRTGIPLGSWEIANLGVSSAATIPTLSVSPIAGTLGTMLPPTIPTVTAPSTPSTTPFTATAGLGCTISATATGSASNLPTPATLGAISPGCPTSGGSVH
jgi:hypothetical protein